LEKNLGLEITIKFIDQHKQILPAERHFILLMILLTNEEPTGQIQSSALELSKIMGLHVRTVQRYISKLRIRNILDVENTFIPGCGEYDGPNKYRVTGWSEWAASHG